jgi:hypothetical protein
LGKQVVENITPTAPLASWEESAGSNPTQLRFVEDIGLTKNGMDD